jgi:hypothetical protein
VGTDTARSKCKTASVRESATSKGRLKYKASNDAESAKAVWMLETVDSVEGKQ